MKTISAIIAASILFSSTAAFAFGDIIIQAPPKSNDGYGTENIDNVPVKQNPFDIGRLNESPIRGAGRISVVHNEPPVESAESKITAARWLLQDNGWQCSMPGRRR